MLFWLILFCMYALCVRGCAEAQHCSNTSAPYSSPYHMSPLEEMLTQAVAKLEKKKSWIVLQTPRLPIKIHPYFCTSLPFWVGIGLRVCVCVCLLSGRLCNTHTLQSSHLDLHSQVSSLRTLWNILFRLRLICLTLFCCVPPVQQEVSSPPPSIWGTCDAKSLTLSGWWAD